MSNQSQHF